MNFKIPIFLLVVLLIFTYTLPCQAKTQFGIIGFDDNDPKFQEITIRELTKILKSFAGFQVVNRSAMKRVVENQEDLFFDESDPDDAIQIGKTLGVDYILIGSIEKLSATSREVSNNDSKDQDKDEKNHSLLGDLITAIFLPRNDSNLQFQGEAGISIKVVNIQTGKVVTFRIDQSSQWCDDYQASLVAALESCFDDRIVVNIRKNCTPPTTIIALNNDFLSLSSGTNIQLNKGIRFKIMTPETIESEKTKSSSQSASKRQIGLIEIIDVDPETSQAKILWNSEPIETFAVLVEVASTESKICLELQGSGAVLTDVNLTSRNRYVQTYKLRFGNEKAFSANDYFSLSYGNCDPISLLTLSGQRTWEYPITPGMTYLTMTGELGYVLGAQKSKDSNSFEFTVGIGFNYYLNHENGQHIEVGLFKQFGPYFNSWKNSDDVDVTNQVQYPKADFSSYGLRATISF